jgi:hypothetical protein
MNGYNVNSHTAPSARGIPIQAIQGLHNVMGIPGVAKGDVAANKVTGIVQHLRIDLQ